MNDPYGGQEYAGKGNKNDRSEKLESCSICGRTFRPDVLARHKNVCLKASKKKRKVFDSGKMRAQGSDIPLNKALKPGQPPPPPDPKLAKAQARKDNWRAKHEEFVSTIRAARQYSKSVESGGPLPPPPPPSINPDFVQCDYCGRRFNEKAAERHIPFCRDKNSRISGDIGNKKPQRAPLKAPQPRMKGSPASTSSGGYGPSGDSRGGIPPPRAGPRGAVNSGSQRSTPSGATGGGSSYQAGRYQIRGANVNSNNSELIDSDEPDYDYAPSNMSSVTNNGVLLRTGKSQRDYLAAQEDIRSPNGYSGIPGPSRVKRPNGYKSSAPRPPQGHDTVGAILANNRTQIAPPSANTLSRFCHDCGFKYPTQTAKFCCECGCRRAIS